MAKKAQAIEKGMDRDLAQFVTNIDRMFPPVKAGGSRGLAVIGNVRELERHPVSRKVYLTLVTMSIKAKAEGYTDKQGKHCEGSGAVMHFKLAQELEGVSLDGRKPLEVCDDLVAAKLIRGGRTGAKGYRIWFVADLMDAPEAKAKQAEPTGVGSAVSALESLFTAKG
jgi:hypothetical protein